jgi:hypothetical protein
MKKIEPSWKNPKYIYVPAVATNILARFKTLGWKPPSEKLRNH